MIEFVTMKKILQPQKVSVLLIMEGSAPRKNSRTIVQKERDVDLIVSLYGLPPHPRQSITDPVKNLPKSTLYL